VLRRYTEEVLYVSKKDSFETYLKRAIDRVLLDAKTKAAIRSALLAPAVFSLVTAGHSRSSLA
jgi:hypothetical protein